MKFVVPDELRELLASAPPHPNPNALSLFNLRVGTRIRYDGPRRRITGRIATLPFNESGSWRIRIKTKTGCSVWTLCDAGLLPAKLVNGKYSWRPPGLEYQSSIKRFLRQCFGFRVDIEPDAMFFPSTPF